MAEPRRQLARVLALSCLWLACTASEGPAPVAWDRTRCAHCGMLVSVPAWAAQRHTAAGEVLHYDDPGCLLAALDEAGDGAAPADRALYFHHHAAERWLRSDEVEFAEVNGSPMGYGLAAHARGELDAPLGLEAARRHVAAIDRTRSSR